MKQGPIRSLKFSKVGLSYDGRSPVIDELDAEFTEGSVTWLRGESGVGKTSVLSLAGLLRNPTEGAITFNGRAGNRLTSRQRAHLRREQIGIIFQNGVLVEHLTVTENILIGGRAKHVDRARISAMLDRLSLSSPLEKQLGATLSAGQRQRVAIVRALVGGPSLVLADEPVSALDESNSEVVLDLLHEHAVHGAMVIVASHDPIVERIADRTIKLAAVGGRDALGVS